MTAETHNLTFLAALFVIQTESSVKVTQPGGDVSYSNDEKEQRGVFTISRSSNDEYELVNVEWRKEFDGEDESVAGEEAVTSPKEEVQMKEPAEEEEGEDPEFKEVTVVTHKGDKYAISVSTGAEENEVSGVTICSHWMLKVNFIKDNALVESKIPVSASWEDENERVQGIFVNTGSNN